MTSIHRISVTLSRTATPQAWQHFVANPLRVVASFPPSLTDTFDDVESLRCEIHASRNVTNEAPLAQRTIDGPLDGVTATFDFTAGEMNQELDGATQKAFWMVIYATYSDADTGIQVFQIGAITLVAHPSSLTAPVPPNASVALSIQAGDARYPTLSDLADVQPAGIVRYAKTGWSDLSDFTVTGTAPTIVNGAIRIGTGYGSWDTQRVMLPSIYNDRDWTIRAIVRIRNLLEYGMAFGHTSVNTWSGQGHSLAASFSPAGASSTVYPEFSGSATTAISVGSLPSLAVNDLVEITIASRQSVVSCTYTNLASRSSRTLKSLKDKNTGRVGFANQGTGFDVLSFSYTANLPDNPSVEIIGDSKSAGSPGDSYISWADRINPNHRAHIFAGPSDRTVEAVQALATYGESGAAFCVMAIGRNDLASSVAAATWKANYAAIVTKQKAAGMSVIHLVIPETIQDQSALKTWLDATYPGDVREYLSGWSNGTHLSGDNVHPNAVGAAYIASVIDSHLPAPAELSQTMTAIARGSRLAEHITESSITVLGKRASYADHAAADADASILSGGTYTLTGSRALYQKP